MDMTPDDRPRKLCLTCAVRKLAGQPAKACVACVLVNRDPLQAVRENTAKKPGGGISLATILALSGGAAPLKPAHATRWGRGGGI